MPIKKLTNPAKKKRFNMNIETSDELRKAFKAKVVMNGKTVKDVIEEFMKEYIKKH
ncbi:MAG: plasmid partition protein ParG [Rickettsiella sp.]|nr:plasmid partition protein ParG [Rickettsiella sp.]